MCVSCCLGGDGPRVRRCRVAIPRIEVIAHVEVDGGGLLTLGWDAVVCEYWWTDLWPLATTIKKA